MNENIQTTSAGVVELMREALTAFYKNTGLENGEEMIARATDAEIVEAYQVMYEELN